MAADAANNDEARGKKRAAVKNPNNNSKTPEKKKKKKNMKKKDSEASNAVRFVIPKKQDTNTNKKRKEMKARKEKAAADASCSFPMSRVWRLIRGEGATITDTRTTNDAVFLINKASEMFLQHFAGDTYANAARGRGKAIGYNNLSSTVCNGKRYEFLSDFVPEKIKAEDALKARALVET